MFVVLFRTSPHFQSCRDDVQCFVFFNVTSRWEGSLCSLTVTPGLALFYAQLTIVGVKFFIRVQLNKTTFKSLCKISVSSAKAD